LSGLSIHPAALKHGIVGADIEHAVRNAMKTDDVGDDLRLYLGPARNAALLEVVTVLTADQAEMAIHAMPMRRHYRRLLEG
jgi:type III secretory pathway component EscV